MDRVAQIHRRLPEFLQQFGDDDGGFHAEEQQFASTVEHTIGGSFDLSFALGVDVEFSVFKADVAHTAQGTFSMTQTMSKTQSSSKGMELHVDLGGVESRGITDHNDRPVLPGEKVDRYRFMTFFQEGDSRHWNDFFNLVVDPEWLASNDEEARALRQAHNAQPNKVWRVRHFVTFVERPALMGFGRDLRSITAATEASEMEILIQRISQLETTLAEMLKLLQNK